MFWNNNYYKNRQSDIVHHKLTIKYTHWLPRSFTRILNNLWLFIMTFCLSSTSAVTIKLRMLYTHVVMTDTNSTLWLCWTLSYSKPNVLKVMHRLFQTQVNYSPVTKQAELWVLSAPIKWLQSILGSFGRTKDIDGGWDTMIWVWKWPFRPAKQYMHVLWSHFKHRPPLVLLPVNLLRNCKNTLGADFTKFASIKWHWHKP